MFQYYHDTNHGDHILVLIPYKNTNTIGGGNGAGDGDPGLEAVLVPVVLVATIVMKISIFSCPSWPQLTLSEGRSQILGPC